MELEDFGLTPTQLAEVEAADKALVEAWLEATASSQGLRSPAGWFLTGVRSGQAPGRSEAEDAERISRVRLAERRVANLGHMLPSEAELVEELFGRRALLEAWRSDELLVARMVSLWRKQLDIPW